MFNEHTLELAIMDKFKAEGWEHLTGNDIHREKIDVLLEDDLRAFLSSRYAQNNITTAEIDSIILELRTISGTLYEANKQTSRLIQDGFVFTRLDRTQKDFHVSFVDYDVIENNLFKIVNQVEIKGMNLRIPDAICYINGLPLVVFEFKFATRENATIRNAYEQLTIGYRRDIPELFKYNAFVVISDGVNNKYGSLFAGYDFFYAWRKVNSEDDNSEGISSLSTMVKGLFSKERIIKFIKDYIYFPDNSKNELKIVARYPQFFATEKLYENIKLHQKPQGDGKGGTYFGATGCGKSFTMLFLTRRLMRSVDFANPTILLVSDRIDLDKQLSEQFVDAKTFIGDENIKQIKNREDLKEKLNNIKAGGVYLTTVYKFTEDLDVLTERENVICISDEAHRSQVNLDKKRKITADGVEYKYGIAKYLRDSLPNATYVGFTGTPIDATIDVFGAVVDSYTMIESVYDDITVNLVYDGRAAKALLDKDKLQEIEDYYTQCEIEGTNEYQIEKSQKAMAKLGSVLGDLDIITEIAKDFVEHYEKRIEEGATVKGKAMFVCADRYIAYDVYKAIRELRPDWAESKMKMVMTRDKNRDCDELYNLLGTVDDRQELDRQFKEDYSEFKIAIVVDMWLTGFDVPCLDTIYIYKPIQEHNLIQTISRVNRKYEGKKNGLIVDYIGIKGKMDKALSKYSKGEFGHFEPVEEVINIVKDQLEVLSNMFYNFNSEAFFEGTPKEKLDCLNNAVEYVQITQDLEIRFMQSVKKMKMAFDLCVASKEISEKERDYIHFYLAVRSIVFKLNKGDAPDVSQMNEKVRKLIEEAIISEGVEEVFKTGKQIEEIDIFSDEYVARIMAIPLTNTKIKIMERLLKQGISEFGKVNRIKSIEFAEALQKIVDDYNNRKGDSVDANEVLDDVVNKLAELMTAFKAEKASFEELDIDYEEKAFYDILEAVSKKFKFNYPHDKMVELSKKVKKVVADKTKFTDWANKTDVKAELRVALVLLLDGHGYPPVVIDAVYKDVLEQAENFRKYA